MAPGSLWIAHLPGRLSRLITPPKTARQKWRNEFKGRSGKSLMLTSGIRYLIPEALISPSHSPGTNSWSMLWTLIVILVVLWLLGFSVFHVAGGLIHLLLVIAVIVLVIKLVTGRSV